MRLLIVCQKVNKDDPVLGFFHRWIIEFAKHFESIVVICLEEGAHDLPSNVKVLSLGKEEGRSRIQYVRRFFSYIIRERRNYDAVYVHMNQEYILLAGWLWRLWGKRVTMWRNHHAGNMLTDLAAFFCTTVFCTSKYSYTAKYKKTLLMPVGIDTEIFMHTDGESRARNSILFLGRIAPSKNVGIFIETLGLLLKRKIAFSADMYGDALPVDIPYFESVRSRARELGLNGQLRFHDGVPNHQTPHIYKSHEVFVNLSSSGMYDKTIFEAMASGCLALASNDNLKGVIDERLVIGKREADLTAQKVSAILALAPADKVKLISEEMAFARTQSLANLASLLAKSI